ncbi:MAG: hypothetical protein JXP73_06540 [Deltaproteobacteria bacterium]|nr:hypothetical protein [Deltaproteobacteria bacterium]
MRAMRPFGMNALVGTWLVGFAACSSVLMSGPVEKRAEGWIIILGQVREGPDQYVGEGVRVNPGRGEKLIWTVVTVKSELGQEETFSYETCALDAKGQWFPPYIVDRNEEAASVADRSETFQPGQERTRRLIFSYPKEYRPTRMKCGAIVLPIQGPR